jgi:hypothetical protein
MRASLGDCLRVASGSLLLFAVLWPATPSEAGDRHEEYYYPKTGSEETYKARARTLADASKAQRLAFVTQLFLLQSQSPYPPRYAIFAKGADSEKMIIVALDDEVFRTLYRARGVLAQLSAFARSSPFFIENGVEDLFTFFDLLKLLGFEQLTISDGDRFAHRININ